MAARSRKLVTRALRQMDRSFWALHDDLATFTLLGLPTFLAFAALGASTALVLRSYDPDPAVTYVAFAILLPLAALTIVTFGPLPCGVFAWFRAHGEMPTAGACLSTCAARLGRLLPVVAWLVFSYAWWSLLFWLPLLFLWPRTCLAPMVALFEDQRRVFQRARKLMHEDHAIYVLAGLYLLLMLVLAGVIVIPRLVIVSDVFKTPWLAQLGDSIWAFELICGILALTGVAISWCVALTLFYHDLRRIREGEALRGKLDALHAKYLAAGGPA